MALSEQFDPFDIDPINVAEDLAISQSWDFDRLGDEQIALTVTGDWRDYEISLVWSAREEMLRLVATFDLRVEEERVDALYKMMGLANDKCWAGAFTYWPEQELMLFRYGLFLSGGATAGPEQIASMLANARVACDRFYPGFQLVACGDTDAEEGMEISMAESFGRA
ncbi:YbjN domain-containing protein [Paracoccaceae bacterium GXU_MW_L88]